jgi:hypothetical protein
MADYFLTAAGAPDMIAALKAVWETNNPPLPEGAQPPEYSEQGWVVHGFAWVLQPAVLGPDYEVVTPQTVKPGYHALMRVHGAALGPVSLGLLGQAAIEIVDAAGLPNPPLVWR